jgi:hypothetical protein
MFFSCEHTYTGPPSVADEVASKGRSWIIPLPLTGHDCHGTRTCQRSAKNERD